MVQDAMPIYGDVGYHEYDGLSADIAECERLASSLGDNMVMIMRNHGLLTCGRTVGEAFMYMYYLERACKVQMRVLASGRDFVLPEAEVCAAAKGQYKQFPYGEHEWPALLRLLDQRSPGYRS